ncbi:MAG TPA: hypothetical protein VFW11_14335 [Cyclobacteriaceae bacterium]|nr:hypothetical protein [Cyclobacteriaceae bacterium]
MKNILIIYPHWPPSNLAGVHRPRLMANYLHLYGWHPIVLTVHQNFYEETPDFSLGQTVADHVEVLKVNARDVRKPRLIGDIGLRGFSNLYRQALRILRMRKIDFIWIPIPSFYMALLGRLLHRKTKVPYGIDYIDPWVRDITGRKNWRNLFSNSLAEILEPIAIKKSVLITGVSEAYYMPALERNFKSSEIISSTALHRSGDLARQNGRVVTHLAFPYGFDPHDHEIKLEKIELPWKGIPGCKPLVYAGAFLPNSRPFIDSFFKSIRALRDEHLWDENVHLFFLGTGNYVGKTIRDYAKDSGIETIVHETRDRFPFLHILNFLSRSFGVMVIGSTERHYTASKVYQAVLSKRPVLALLHEESSACRVLKEVKAGDYTVDWTPALGDQRFQEKIRHNLSRLISGNEPWSPDYTLLEEKYSSRALAKSLADGIDDVLRLARK